MHGGESPSGGKWFLDITSTTNFVLYFVYFACDFCPHDAVPCLLGSLEGPVCRRGLQNYVVLVRQAISNLANCVRSAALQSLIAHLLLCGRAPQSLMVARSIIHFPDLDASHILVLFYHCIALDVHMRAIAALATETRQTSKAENNTRSPLHVGRSI